MNKFKKNILLFVAHSNFLQKIASIIVLIIPQILTHNIEKYKIIKNIFYTLDMDDVKGDYLEFGCFTGSSLKHAINCYKKIFTKNKNNMFFYGFDSFQGFPENVHKTFTDEIFKTNFSKEKKIETNYNNCKIVKGFFDKSLKNKKLGNKITKISFAFIDCDLAISAKPVFKFIKPRLSNGAFIMIDDYFNLDKKGNSILKEFSKYKKKKQFHFYKTFGTSGKVYRYFK